MKTNVILLLVVILSVIACSTDDDITAIKGLSQDEVSYTLDGSVFINRYSCSDSDTSSMTGIVFNEGDVIRYKSYESCTGMITQGAYRYQLSNDSLYISSGYKSYDYKYAANLYLQSDGIVYEEVGSYTTKYTLSNYWNF